MKAYRENLYDAGASEHDFISNFYIPKIVNALKAYDPNLGTDSEYEKIAWAGLQETKAYDNKPNKDTFDSIIWDNIKIKMRRTIIFILIILFTSNIKAQK